MKFANMRLVNILSLSAPIIVIITALGSIQAEQPPSDKVKIEFHLINTIAINSKNQCLPVLQIRTFAVDYTNNRFLKDNEPFRFIAGSFHYFRALPETWRIKLRTMRAAGLNAVTTYIEWSLHNPRDGVYIWDGIGDIERFIQLAADEDLYVILRPGPYICAERDNVNKCSMKIFPAKMCSIRMCRMVSFSGRHSILAIHQISKHQNANHRFKCVRLLISRSPLCACI